jgi:hypothetical protein
LIFPPLRRFLRKSSRAQNDLGKKAANGISPKNRAADLARMEQKSVRELVPIAATRRWRRFPMKRFVQAGFVAMAIAASATAAIAMPRVPASAIAGDDSGAVVLVKGGHGHGHMGHHGGRGHHYGWGRGRGHHYGWGRGHHHRHHH